MIREHQDPAALAGRIDTLYREHPLRTRLFVKARQRLFPFDALLARTPAAGRVLDVGCGHGIFSLLLAHHRPGVEVVGIDPDAAKIAALRRASAALGNVRFECTGIDQLDDDRPFDCAALLDVLIYLPRTKQLDLLARVRERLKPGGVLLIAMNDVRPRWQFAITYLQERCMTLLGLTRSETLCFSAPRDMRSWTEDLGFATEVCPLPARAVYPHVLIIGQRTDLPAARTSPRGGAPRLETQGDLSRVDRGPSR